MPEMSLECALDFSCSSQLISDFSGAAGYVAKIQGTPRLIKAGTGDELPLTQLSVINEGDTIVIADGENAVIMFPGNNLRSFWGESEITVYSSEKSLRLQGEGKGWFADTIPGKIVRELLDSERRARAVTITGTGDYIKDYKSLAEKQYFQEHPEELYVEYGINSEVIFEISKDSQTVKVIEGSVTVENNQGEKAEVSSGEKYTSRAQDAGVKDDFNYKSEEFWWTEGFEKLRCGEFCPKGFSQTPYPGCSCIEAGAGGETSGGCCSPAIGLILSSLVFIFSKKQF